MLCVSGTSESQFYEGDFLNVVFKKLRNILDQASSSDMKF